MYLVPRSNELQSRHTVAEAGLKKPPMLYVTKLFYTYRNELHDQSLQPHCSAVALWIY